jgi:hypothetical protein
MLSKVFVFGRRSRGGAGWNARGFLTRSMIKKVKLSENVIRLGTETLYAIADELRRMYDADLRSRPSEQLERLIQRIERGDDVSGQNQDKQRP